MRLEFQIAAWRTRDKATARPGRQNVLRATVPASGIEREQREGGAPVLAAVIAGDMAERDARASPGASCTDAAESRPRVRRCIEALPGRASRPADTRP